MAVGRPTADMGATWNPFPLRLCRWRTDNGCGSSDPSDVGRPSRIPVEIPPGEGRQIAVGIDNPAVVRHDKLVLISAQNFRRYLLKCPLLNLERILGRWNRSRHAGPSLLRSTSRDFPSFFGSQFGRPRSSSLQPTQTAQLDGRWMLQRGSCGFLLA